LYGNFGFRTRLVKIFFGAADFGLSMLAAAMQFYMLFYYTGVVKIDPGLAGTAMLIGKLTWDLVNDVLCGYISDRTRPRWGRRRPCLFFGAAPLALSFWLMFSLPAGLEGAWSALGLIFGTLAAVSVLITAVMVRQKPVLDHTSHSNPPRFMLFSNTCA
jgi:GPH family glycoside/pentoside/hexuronide:cation symporter